MYENIQLNLYPPFVKAIDEVSNKYGDKFIKYNTLTKEQLNFTTFIDNFIDSNNVANASIDANANVKAKDICSLENEMNKPHMKLLSYNKIFYELTKAYGEDFAKTWLEEEWNGASYLHDSYSATFKSYCYHPDTRIAIIVDGQKQFASMKDAFRAINMDASYDAELEAFVKYPKDFFVYDVDKQNESLGKWTKVTRFLYHPNNKKMYKFTFSNNDEIIVTEDHPIIVVGEENDIPANEATVGMQVYSVNDIDLVINSGICQICHDDVVTITDITETDPCESVYDITTETGHFLVNNILSHNCFAYDLEDLVNHGLYFVSGFGGGAPKHFTTFVAHVKEFVSWTSNRTSGACGLPSFLVHAFYFWKHDVETNYYMISPEYYRDQCFQEFIFGLNQPYLRISQCAFTNISIMDRPYLEEIFGGRQFPDGTYAIDYIDEIIEFQKAFMKVVSDIRTKMMFTFPVLTYSLLYQNGKFIDEDFARWCSDHNTEWCDSNFFVGSDVTSLSSCCRLVNDFSKLDGFINSIGGTSLKIGSVKVNTMNLMRIAYESEKDKTKYMEILTERTHHIIKTLDVIRSIIVRNVEKGLLPNYSQKLIELKNQYNTIGINALYEAVRYFGYVETDEFGNKSYTQEGLDFACEILDKINEIKDTYKFDYSINIEAVPAERCAVILCQKDNELYKNEYDDYIYANQWIPLTEKCSLDEKIQLGSLLDKRCGGGQIMHVNVDGQFQSKDQAWDMLNYIANKGVIYFAFNNKISVCEDGHGFYGETCPHCGKPKVDTYQRIVGYLVPSANYSKDRFKEFSNRYWYNLNDDNM